MPPFEARMLERIACHWIARRFYIVRRKKRRLSVSKAALLLRRAKSSLTNFPAHGIADQLDGCGPFHRFLRRPISHRGFAARYLAKNDLFFYFFSLSLSLSLSVSFSLYLFLSRRSISRSRLPLVRRSTECNDCHIRRKRAEVHARSDDYH